jgi:TrwC relaxase
LSHEDLMLSIGKLATGQADYYLEQAEGRVDRVGSVSSGVEDYYFEGSVPDGVWLGGGAAQLGLGGPVTADQLRRVLEGRHPTTGELFGRHAAARVPGFDVTFSAPKSVSVLFGVADERLRRTIRAAHDTAVRDAFAYSSVRRRSRVAVPAGASASAAAGSSPQRSGIARRGQAILSCTRTSSSRTLSRPTTGGGRRSTAGACTPTPRRPATSTRRGCELS